MINPIGVTTKKNIIPITNGEIIFPKNIPNLNHNLLKGFRIFESIRPNNKKSNERIKDQSRISLEFIKGYIAITKKTTKKTIPKFLFELILISFIILLYC